MRMIVIKPFLKTPLLAAFFCAACLSACAPEPENKQVQCSSQTTPIANVQGNGDKSPLLNQLVTVRGVVSLLEPEQGFYLEEPESDTNQDTSNALYVQTATFTSNITRGSSIVVQGRVAEIGESRDTLTAITDTTGIELCASSQPLPLTPVGLPLDTEKRESLEAMRIHMDGPVSVTDVYQFGRGNITLSGNGLQYVPTEVMMPGPKVAAYLSRNRSFTLPAKIPLQSNDYDVLVSGMTVEKVTGVMAHDKRGKRVSLETMETPKIAAFEPPEPAGDGVIRAVGMNLYNYFNGDGKGAGFPTPRGAKSAREFQAQRARIGAAIRLLDPQVVAVMELENDGFDANSAAQDFIRLTTGATNHRWRVARPKNDDTGSDKITVGIFYREDQLQAIGPAHTLTGPEFERSRQPQAQLFERRDNGERLLIVINHLKSKGSCPESGENADQKDGQGCWNPMRRAAAKIMSAWANRVAMDAGTNNILILGDMNAYRNEDPIEMIRQAGFTELMDRGQGSREPEHSFAYFGQHGTLDYAFVSKQLHEKIKQAYIWKVNATLPAHTRLPRPWLRFSDHDPVIVDVF